MYTTAVGVISPRQLAGFRYVFCSLRSHGTRFAYGRLRAQALSQPCLVMGRWRGVLSGDDKLTTANLCDRKKRRGLRDDVMTHQ